MAITSAQVTVTTTATQLADTVAGTSVCLFHHGGSALFVGPLGVTAATGMLVPPGQAFTLPMKANTTLYGITAAGTCTVGVLVA